MSILSREAKFYLCEEAAAGERFDFAPGEIISAPSHPTISAYVKSGHLKPLKDRPGDWVRTRALTAENLAAVPNPGPAPEAFLEAEEVVSRLGWSLDDLQAARTRKFFPAPDRFIGPGPEEDPEASHRRPQWLWSTISRWQNENGGLLARLGALVKTS